MTWFGVENEDRTIDRLSCQVALESFVDRHSVDIGVVHKPNYLVWKQLTVVLRIEIGFGRFTGVKLEALADALSENVKRGVGLHDFIHRLLQQLLSAIEPASIPTVEIVS